MAEIFKFPYDACRRVHSKKPRRSKNGTPEERATKSGTRIDTSGPPCGRPFIAWSFVRITSN
jgi:hypothetical protein